MDLCTACHKVAEELSTLISAGRAGPSSTKPIRHGLSFAALDSTRATCRLCQLLAVHNPVVADRKRRGLENAESIEDFSADYSIEILPVWVADRGLHSRSPHIAPSAVPKSLRYLHINVTREDDPPDTSESEKKPFPVVLSIYGIRDTPPVLAGSLWSRYRFRDSTSEDSLSLLRKWLDNCLRDHPKCKADGPEGILGRAGRLLLPTRVIDVGPSDGSLQPQLLISNGGRGDWVALSHCWGNPAMRPLETTRLTLKARLEQIHMDELPQSFRDAVTVTRALGIRYLWIDSLCIVQDDLDDWRKECETMRHVYRSAVVTIAAADATNSRQGLFSNTGKLSYSRLKEARYRFSRMEDLQRMDWDAFADEWEGPAGEGVPPVTEAVELPYNGNANLGVFYISAQDDEVVNPIHSPLFDRGWVTQEWVLSRRTILFHKDSLVWACQEIQEDERGNSINIERPPVRDWLSVVESFSRKQLTRESDRLAAIKGLANRRGELQSHTYFAGMWHSDLPASLLWIKPTRCTVSEDFSHLPSWTWARTAGPVGFQLGSLRHEDGGASRLGLACDPTINISPDGSLQITGPVKQVERMMDFNYKGNININTFSNAVYRATPEDVAFLKRCFNGKSNCRQTALGSLNREGLTIILKPNGTRVGWAAWDLCEAPNFPVYCLALVLEQSCILPILAVREGITDAYHVLFLRKEPLATDRFVRVGSGVILKEEWFETALKCTVTLA